MQRYAVALDLETTGLLNGASDDHILQPGIVEIGAVRYEISSWMIDSEYSTLVNPEKHFEEKAKKITGIEDDLTKFDNFVGAFPRLAHIMHGAHYLITFNGLGFDIPVLQYQLKRYNLAHTMPWPLKHIDLMHLSKNILNLQGKQGNKFPKLDELCEHCGIQRNVKHRALDDAIDTMMCAQYLYKDNLLIGVE